MSDRSGIFAGDNPFHLAQSWLAEAEATEVNDPNAIALASVDAVLMADDADAPVHAIGRQHLCLWPGRVDAACRRSLQTALVDTAGHGRVFSVHAPQFEMTAAHTGATLRARTLSRFFQDIRQGQRGDVDGRVAALLAASLTSQA